MPDGFVKPTLDMITSKLRPDSLAESVPPRSLSDPLSDTPMRVSLDQLRPYEHNPRFIRNPRYDDLKASIRERGLDQPPPITRRPGEAHYIIRTGGNTRLAILNELWRETADQRFFYIQCLFKPWTDETSALLGHLAENDLHGRLTFIERALSIAKLKALFEQEGQTLSQSELARRLSAGGYPVSQPHISRMFDTLEHLLPALPQTLYAGLGKPQIERLLGLRKQAQRVWDQYPGAASVFDDLWINTLSEFDTPEAFAPERIRDQLLQGMSQALGQPKQTLLRELDPAAAPSQRREGDDQSPPRATRPDAIDGPQPVIQGPAATPPTRVQRIRQTIDRLQEDEPILAWRSSALWRIEPELDNAARLRQEILRLARDLAEHADTPDSIVACDQGLGFTCLAPATLDTPRSASVHLLLTALLRAHDDLDWHDRRQLPAALFGQVLLGIYQLLLPGRPAEDIGLERLPDPLLIQLFRLIRLARHLIDPSPAPES